MGQTTETTDQPVPGPSNGQKESMLGIEREMKRIETSIPEISIREFSCPLLFTPYKVNPNEARERFIAAGMVLPKGVKPERVAASSRPVFVPMWLVSGAISGKWNATGIEVETWEVDCPNCFGTGKTGGRGKSVQCSSCWGSGKEKQSKKSKQPASGESSAAIRECIDNNGTGITLPLDLDKSSETFPVAESDKSRWTCIRPGTVYPAAVSEVVKNRLVSAIDEKAKAALSRFSRIEGFRYIDETIESQSAVSAWLYPAYSCWFEADGRKHFAVCDGVTGTVVLPRSYVPSPGKGMGNWPKTAGIIVGVVVALAAMGWYLRSMNRPDHASPAEASKTVPGAVPAPAQAPVLPGNVGPKQ